jgi:hypothetical protein
LFLKAAKVICSTSTGGNLNNNTEHALYHKDE